MLQVIREGNCVRTINAAFSYTNSDLIPCMAMPMMPWSAGMHVIIRFSSTPLPFLALIRATSGGTHQAPCSLPPSTSSRYNSPFVVIQEWKMQRVMRGEDSSEENVKLFWRNLWTGAFIGPNAASHPVAPAWMKPLHMRYPLLNGVLSVSLTN